MKIFLLPSLLNIIIGSVVCGLVDGGRLVGGFNKTPQYLERNLWLNLLRANSINTTNSFLKLKQPFRETIAWVNWLIFHKSFGLERDACIYLSFSKQNFRKFQIERTAT